ncbi:MAG: TIGR03560 family F420-dependent LLM class oxidoreductase [Pseudomonadales bacterium]|nr:TIGR03560 family F420-dependent LLM class oxidoreductase [Pseudomonadales bacterium]
MQFGIKTPPQQCSWQDMAAIWRATDEIPTFTSCWNFDHFYPLVGDENGPCMEAWVTLSALAAMTKRVRIGCMVNGTPYRHPAVIANMAATLDIVSNGRLNLGLGAGWHEGESAAYGIDLLPIGQRMDRFEESVQIVRDLLTQQTTTFAGTYYDLASARCEPKGPQQNGPPIVIGGGGEKRTLHIAAQYADHWNLPFASPAQFAAKYEVLEQHCATVGRDIAEIECSVQVALPPDQDPGVSAGIAAELRAVGVDTVIYTLRNPYRVDILEPLATALERI